jgi:hypothetical protein
MWETLLNSSSSPSGKVTGITSVRLGIDDIIRTILTYFVVFSEISNAKYARNHSEMHMKNIGDAIDP